MHTFLSKEEFLQVLAEEGVPSWVAEDCWRGWENGGRLAALTLGKLSLEGLTAEGERDAIRSAAREAKVFIEANERHSRN